MMLFILIGVIVERKYVLIRRRGLNDHSLVAFVAGITRGSLTTLHTSDKSACWAVVIVLKNSITSDSTSLASLSANIGDNNCN